MFEKEFEDTRGVIRIRKSKDRQHNVPFLNNTVEDLIFVKNNIRGLKRRPWFVDS
jgi:hypothetical protein